MSVTREERARLLRLIAGIYSDGYAEGMGRAATEYDLQGLIPAAGQKMPRQLEERLSLVEAAVDKYLVALERKGNELAHQGLTGEVLYAEVLRYAQDLAQSRGQMIAELEFAQARMDGAKNIVDESGMPHEWRFPHFELASPGHEECEICEAIREGSPYTTEEAEMDGFPSVPHANCDHGWVLVPKGEPTRTEAFPPLAIEA